MKYFNIDTEFNFELLNTFLAFCNENNSEQWTIFINTRGGSDNILISIHYLINLKSDNCTLVCLNAYSAGFWLFYHAKCNKLLSRYAKGMYHLPSSEMSIQTNGRPRYIEDECLVKNWKDGNKDEIDFAQSVMTKKEFADYKKGKDIYFHFARMKEIFPDVEVI